MPFRRLCEPCLCCKLRRKWAAGGGQRHAVSSSWVAEGRPRLVQWCAAAILQLIEVGPQVFGKFLPPPLAFEMP